jgi:hypothetical protein
MGPVPYADDQGIDAEAFLGWLKSAFEVRFT